MGQGVLVTSILLCVLSAPSYAKHSNDSSIVNLHTEGGRDKRFHDGRRSLCKKRLEIPRILHHVFLEGEAAFWRNATVGDDFTSNFYPKARKDGDKNATFRHVAC